MSDKSDLREAYGHILRAEAILMVLARTHNAEHSDFSAVLHEMASKSLDLRAQLIYELSERFGGLETQEEAR